MTIVQGEFVLSSGSRVKRRAHPKSGRAVMPPDVPEATAAEAPKTTTDDDLLPDDIRKMLEAAYT